MSEEKPALPKQARVVVVGGGILGCGVAYHLTQMGWQDVVLLEKGELTSGSTWHAAGQVSYSHSSYTLGKCVAYNIDLYKRLEAETGQSATWHGCGSLRMAYDEEERSWLEHCVSVMRGLELPAEIVPPKRIAELHPFYNLSGVVAGLHTPIDGHVDPSGAAQALAKGARQRGAKIIRQCRVVGIKQQANGEWLAQTEQGDIVCEHLVNAGGAYARQMALWNGYDLPTTSMTHHYFVTEPCPELADLPYELPVVRDDSQVSGYIRQEQKSGLIGIYEKQNANTVWEDGAPWEAENELFEADYERVSPWLENAMERVPIFAKLGIRRVVHGVISHPPDGNPLIGPAPGLRNYWCCAGCQIGFGWGPALTRELALWITQGAADFNMRDFDPRRFGAYANGQYQVIKGKEDYTLRHEIPYPHFSRLAARPQRTSALYEALTKAGAVNEEVCGWERPRWFATGDIPAKDIYSFRRDSRLHAVVGGEVMAVRERAGVIDISAFAKVEVCGANAAALLDKIVPNKLPAAGRIGLAHLLTEGGRMEVETSVARLAEDRFYFVCAAFFERRLVDYLSRHLRGGAEIINHSDNWGAIALNGPKAREVLSQCADGNVENAAFPWLHLREMTVGGGKVVAFRLSYAGELGWELHGEQAAVARAYAALMEAGKPAGIANYGIFALNAMRMEKAFAGAAELTNEVNLPEADLMRFANMDKENFVGKAATASALNAPLRWKCAYLQVEDNGKEDGAGGEGVFADGKRIGMITSIAYGHAVNKLLAFAYLARQNANAGDECEVLIMGKLRKAKVLPAAAYDPKNERPRA